MRIGVNGRFLSAAPGGVQRFALEVVRRLAAREDVVLLLPRGAHAPEALGPVPVYRGGLGGHAWEQLELPRAARRAGADVVLNPANAAPLWGGPNVVVLHDLSPLAEPGTFRPAYRLWVRVAHVAAARRARRVLSVSAWSAADVARALGVGPGRVGVVLQGAAPLDAPASADAVEAVRARHGLPERYFLAATGGDPRKGAALLREVWRGWTGTPPTLALVGNRWPGVHANGDGLDEGTPGVRVLGRVPDEDLRALYTGTVALLYPSTFEGFGRPPVEALACGTRVLVTPYGPAREVLGDACDHIAADAPAWGRALCGLLAEAPAERRRRVAAGREHAARYSWDEAVDGVIEACRSAAEPGG